MGERKYVWFNSELDGRDNRKSTVPSDSERVALIGWQLPRNVQMHYRPTKTFGIGTDHFYCV